MLGADHHGYVGRLRAIAACFGDDPEPNLEVLIGQLVNLVKDGEPVRMSKRAGNVVTLDDLVDAIGVDAARYALARYPATRRSTSTSTCGPGRPTTTRSTTCSTRTRGSSSLRATPPSLGIERGPDEGFDPALLVARPRRPTLLGALGEFPRVVATAAELREPHRVARYLEELAGDLPPVLRRLPGAAAGRRAGDRRSPAPGSG